MAFTRKAQLEEALKTIGTPSDYEGRTLWQETKARFFRNKAAVVGMCFVIFLLILSVASYVIDLVDGGKLYTALCLKQDLPHKLLAPCLAHPFGCDEYGRDIMLRMFWGTRYSISLGILSVIIATILGCTIGSVAGFYGGRIDDFLMRIMDVMLAIPYTLLAIAIMSALSSNIFNLALSIGIPEVPQFARIMRAQVMTIKDRDFVEAARASGAGTARIILGSIIPNCFAPVIVQCSLRVAGAILGIAGLSYIGLGIQPPTPEWGAMLSSAKNYIRDAWHVTVIPGLAIVLTVLALNMFGDGVRDALDPNMKR